MSGADPVPISRAQIQRLRRVRDRLEADLCLVEGERLLGEALQAGRVPALVVAEPALLACEAVRRAAQAGAEVVQARPKEAARLADRVHGAALLAAVPVPPSWDGAVEPDGPVLVIVLCGLQDPGNVGALMRSALAFGAAGCLITPGTADPFAPKVLRSSAGSALRLPLARADVPGLPAYARSRALDLCAASLPRGEEGPAGADPPGRCLLLFGHETRGVPSLPGMQAVSVGHEPAVESLNVAVAGSILMARWYGHRGP